MIKTFNGFRRISGYPGPRRFWAILSRCQLYPHFFEQLFHTKVFCKAFLFLQVRFEFFWRKNFDAKAACKMLVKSNAGDVREHHRMWLRIRRRILFTNFGIGKRFYQKTFRSRTKVIYRSKIQRKPPNVIMVNVLNRLLWSDFHNFIY